jgi:hypothetical protein
LGIPETEKESVMKVYLVKNEDLYLGIVWAKSKDAAARNWDEHSDPSNCEFIPITESGSVGLGSFHSGFTMYDIRSTNEVGDSTGLNRNEKGFTNLLMSDSIMFLLPHEEGDLEETD